MGQSKIPPLSPKNNSQNSKKSPSFQGRGGVGFFESLKDIGKSVSQSVTSDVLQGTARSFHDQLLGASGHQNPDQTLRPDLDIAQWLNLEEQKGFQEGIVAERKRQRTQEQVVFDSHEQRIKQEIAAVRQELQLLAQAVKKVSLQTEQAISQEVVNPGVYHLTFLQKLRSWLHTLRKSIQDGELWLEMWHSRSQKSRYWLGVKKSGTKYMLSGERNLATQTG